MFRRDPRQLNMASQLPSQLRPDDTRERPVVLRDSTPPARTAQQSPEGPQSDMTSGTERLNVRLIWKRPREIGSSDSERPAKKRDTAAPPRRDAAFSQSLDNLSKGVTETLKQAAELREQYRTTKSQSSKVQQLVSAARPEKKSPGISIIPRASAERHVPETAPAHSRADSIAATDQKQPKTFSSFGEWRRQYSCRPLHSSATSSKTSAPAPTPTTKPLQENSSVKQPIQPAPVVAPKPQEQELAFTNPPQNNTQSSPRTNVPQPTSASKLARISLWDGIAEAPDRSAVSPTTPTNQQSSQNKTRSPTQLSPSSLASPNGIVNPPPQTISSQLPSKASASTVKQSQTENIIKPPQEVTIIRFLNGAQSEHKVSRSKLIATSDLMSHTFSNPQIHKRTLTWCCDEAMATYFSWVETSKLPMQHSNPLICKPEGETADDDSIYIRLTHLYSLGLVLRDRHFHNIVLDAIKAHNLSLRKIGRPRLPGQTCLQLAYHGKFPHESTGPLPRNRLHVLLAEMYAREGTQADRDGLWDVAPMPFFRELWAASQSLRKANVQSVEKLGECYFHEHPGMESCRSKG